MPIQTLINGETLQSHRNKANSNFTELDSNLLNKVDKVTGKGLSTNDYTDEEKAIVASVENSLDLKVDSGTGTQTPFSLTIIDNTHFSLTDGNGHIGEIQITWAGYSNVLDQFPTFTVTWLLIDSNGTLIQQTNPPSQQDTRDNILIGALGKTNGVILFARTITFPIYDGFNIILDIARILGALQDGNIKISGNTDLTLNRSSGKIFSIGSNMFDSTNGPNFSFFTSASPFNFYGVYRNPATGDGWSITSLLSTISPLLYDNGTGTLANMATNKYSIRAIYMSSTGKIYIQYGQFLYNSMSEAIDGIYTEARTDWFYAETMVRLAFIIMRGGTTSTNNTSDCKIINLGKFGNGGSASGSTGGSGDMSTSVYDSAGIAEQLVGLTATQTIINKTINFANNTIIGVVPNTRTITINGVTYDLSTDRTWTISGGSTSLSDVYISNRIFL